jgi:hypothetical protein
MVEAITGNLLLDTIIFSILTGGGVISLLTLLSDRLTKRRTDYVNMSSERIKKFSNSQLIYIHLASYYAALSSQLKGRLEKKGEIHYELCIFYMCNILYLLHKFTKQVGIVQLDNLYVEWTIWELMLTLYNKIQDPKLANKINYHDASRLRMLINDKTTYQSYYELIHGNEEEVYNIAKKWLSGIEEKEDELEDLEKKSRWYSKLINIEVMLMYEIYYGKNHIHKSFREEKHTYLDNDLLLYLENSHPGYYRRLVKLKIVENDLE